MLAIRKLVSLNMKWLLVIFVSLLQDTAGYVYLEHDIEWSYHGPAGPRHWCSMFDNCCGRSQSPLDLRFGKHDTALKEPERFLFINYDVPLQSVVLLNTGHTAMLQLADKIVIPKVSGGLLNKTYVFEQLHFHWGSTDVVGSEHTIEGNRYPIELHIVHYAEEYKNLTHAINSNSSDALLVIGIFYNIEAFNNTNLLFITENLESIRYKNEKTQLKTSLKLNTFLPPDTTQFFRYKGSLTTPACNQVVSWTIFGVPSHISRQQLKKFRRLMVSKKGEELPQEMADNYRPIQDINGREFDIHSES